MGDRSRRHGRLGARPLYEINCRYLGRTDMSEDCEFTDWDEVETFARRFLASLPASTHTDA